MGKIYRAVLISGPSILQMETIEHDGRFWLVPDWIVSRDQKLMKPLRIISLATIPHTDLGEGQRGHRFVVHGPVRQSTLRGHPPPEEANLFEIVESPEIIFPNPDAPGPRPS